MAARTDGLRTGDQLPSGRYRIGAAVPNAQGAFGTVFQGEDEAGNRRAIKKMKMSAAIDNLRAIYPNLPNPRGHMAREWSCTLLELSHPNLCRTFAVEFTDRAGRRSDLANCEFAYLVMEWAGDALIDVVLARGGLREFESRGYFYQILVGIQALHARGIAHRDIKPENVTLGEPAPGEQLGVIKIVDFGLAKSASQGPPISDVGTPRYKAPEIATSCRRGLLYNDKVDVWSLGCTLYEMLTAKGSMANKRDGVGRMNKAAYKHGEVPMARDIIRRCLNNEPSLRPTVAELLQDSWFSGIQLPAAAVVAAPPKAAAAAAVVAAQAMQPQQERRGEAAEAGTGSELGGGATGAGEDGAAAAAASAGASSIRNGSNKTSEEEYGRLIVLQLSLKVKKDEAYLIDEEVTYDDIVGIATGGSELRGGLHADSVAQITQWHAEEQAITQVEVW